MNYKLAKKISGLAVSLNGKCLVTVSTEGLNILTVRVHGDVIGPEFASIDMSGGLYEGAKDDKHLIWLDEQEIGLGDEIEVAFLEEASTTDSGKTIEELCPDDEAQMGPWQSRESIFEDLATKPKVREWFAFWLSLPSGETINSRTGANDHSFGFSVVWDWTRPDTAQVSLGSNSLEGIKHRQGRTEHARFRLQYGQNVKFRVGA